MPKHIAFLHTSQVHVETFDKLAKAADPHAVIDHVVDESLLLDAQRIGTDDAGLVQRVHAAIARAASGGASVAICTCSTIGGIAEGALAGERCTAARIDRAMADKAVEMGRRILIVAALKSTVEPTAVLVAGSAARVGATLEIRSLVVAGAWEKFLAGAGDDYISAIAAAVRKHLGEADVVVLAQASMAPAADRLCDLHTPVLASPKLGVETALLNARSNGAV